MSKADVEYNRLIREILQHGVEKGDRTGTGTLSLFGQQMRFDLSEEFPLLTTKRVWFKGVALELLWFLRGSGNVRWLQEQGVSIWDEWADENGDLGPVYGVQWRHWGSSPDVEVDQIAQAVDLLRNDPSSRRIMVTAWNPSEVELMALPPCHAMFQFYVADGKLSCHLYQRSADMFLGVPFNIASYALLTHMMAKQANLEVGELVWTGGDCHIYSNHQAQVAEQLSRETDRNGPTLYLPSREIDEYEYEDFVLVGYDPHPAIPAPVAV